MEIPLPWERLLWSGGPVFVRAARERYLLTDLRLVRLARGEADEIVLHDIGEIQRSQSPFERAIGRSTLIVRPKEPRRRAVVLRRIRRGQQFAALLDLLSGESPTPVDPDSVRAALAWDPRAGSGPTVEALAAVALVALAVFGVAVGLRGNSAPPPAYASDDPMYPGGTKRSQAEIMRFMRDEVTPWARTALGPLKGGSGRVTCETCHGTAPDRRGWRMPAVSALPEPDLKISGWERYSGVMDAQMRNAIYGYVAGSENQAKAAYMREVVMPGMARLLHRPAYDFTRPYGYNRSQLAFGCYHCHLID